VTMHTWFLIVSLFLPRLSLFIEWWEGYHFPFNHPWDALSWVFVPRLMILVMIYQWQGFGVWFWLHLVAALLALGAGGKSVHDR
jgi:hypothetical protein